MKRWIPRLIAPPLSWPPNPPQQPCFPQSLRCLPEAKCRADRPSLPLPRKQLGEPGTPCEASHSLSACQCNHLDTEDSGLNPCKTRRSKPGFSCQVRYHSVTVYCTQFPQAKLLAFYGELHLLLAGPGSSLPDSCFQAVPLSTSSDPSSWPACKVAGSLASGSRMVLLVISQAALLVQHLRSGRVVTKVTRSTQSLQH